MGRVFQIALRGKEKILFPQCSGMINFAGEIFLSGGGNLKRIDFNRSENCHLVGRRMGTKIWWGGGGIFPGGGGGGMGKFLARNYSFLEKSMTLFYISLLCHSVVVFTKWP